MTFPRRERRSGCGVVGSQISNHRRLKCTLRRHCCGGFSLASSFYVYAPACCVVALPGLFNSQAHRAQEWCSPKLSLLLTFVDSGCQWSRPPSPTRGCQPDPGFPPSQASPAGRSRSRCHRWSRCPSRASSTGCRANPLHRHQRRLEQRADAE